MGDLMKGKRGLVMGVANHNSIAWGIARLLGRRRRASGRLPRSGRPAGQPQAQSRAGSAAGSIEMTAGPEPTGSPSA